MENAVLRILLLCSTAFAACTPSPQDAAMRKSSPVPGAIMPGSSAAGPKGRGPATSGPTGQDANERVHAVQGPVPEPVSAADNPGSIPASAIPALGVLGNTPAEALGRRIVSTAFVMVGPDGNLTVELLNGQVLVLHNVVMRPRDYCGLHMTGRPNGTKYCGRYADVAAARPGGLAAPVEPGPAASNPLAPEHGPFQRN